jgi:hypothetical protein
MSCGFLCKLKKQWGSKIQHVHYDVVTKRLNSWEVIITDIRSFGEKRGQNR